MVSIIKIENQSPQRRRRRRLRAIVPLPTLLTLGNLLCGFAAIHFGLRAMFAAGAGIDSSVEATLNSQMVERMLPSFLSIGAMLIFVGMLMDLLDGLAARLTDTVSHFGAQMDSLADVVSFGVAPAILVVALMMREWHGEVVVTPLSVHVVGRLMWVCAAVYCMCGAVRLARYNVEHDLPEFSHRTFRGLPIPGAAAVMASAVMVHEHLDGAAFRSFLLGAFPVIALVLGFLMVSRVRYERITQVYLVRRRPFEHLIVFVIVFVVFLSYKAQTLAVLCCLYALSGPVMTLVRRMGRAGAVSSEAPTDVQDAEEDVKKSRLSG